MVASTTGTMILRGASGRQYAYSIYISDVVGAFVTFATNGVAGTGSQTFIITPEDCILVDISTLLSPTVALTIAPFVNDVSTGNVILDANTLSTLPNRAIPNIGFRAGRKLTFVQA
jgi:hypothetical protein